MPYAPVLAGLAIQAGAVMIQAGIKKIVPEVSKLLDEPDLEEYVDRLRIGEVVNDAVVKLLKRGE